ncbi:MAG: Rrf2 family transcriptional regulator [Verrucomicrobia bacterium]|nr:Rrf2 family transcriptional regulator [Verrucomicrobiota bacterium]
MHLTKKGEYALRTLIRLGLALRSGRDVVSVSELADGEHLPFKFIENILQELRQAGYVESKRGKDGGLRLAKPMKEITIGELVRLIDGRLAPIGCASETDYEKCTCPDELHCGLRMLMIDVRNAIAQILDRYTLDDVVSVTLGKFQRDGVAPPFALVPKKKSTRKAASKITRPQRVRHADPLDGFFAVLGQARAARVS